MKSAAAYLVLLVALVASAAEEGGGSSFPKFTSNDYRNKKRDSAGSGIPGGFFGPGYGFGSIPGWTNSPWSKPGGGGYGAGYGGDGGGQSRNGVVRPSVVCKEKGPCFNKELICPARCFRSFSRSSKNGGSGGGSGSCSIDCKKKCVASC